MQEGEDLKNLILQKIEEEVQIEKKDYWDISFFVKVIYVKINKEDH
jgi:translation elongation factor EF-1beta